MAFRVRHDRLEVLLHQRPHQPFQGEWALPGGYNAAGQTTQQALHDIVLRKVGLDTTTDLRYLEQLYTVDSVARDPRGHAVSVVYLGLGQAIEAPTDNDSIAFWPVDDLPSLAYDHAEIIHYGRQRLSNKLGYSTLAASLLAPQFTLSQLQTTYEAVLGRALDKRNFRKRILQLNIITETGQTWRSGAHRPAKLYRFLNDDLTTISTPLSLPV